MSQVLSPRKNQTQKKMATDRETELGFLSLILFGEIEGAWGKAIADGITAESFGADDCREIWEICARRVGKGYPLGFTEVKAAIRNNRPEAASVGTVSEIVEQSLSNPSWSACVGVIQDRWARRIASEALSRATDANGPQVVQILARAAEAASEALSVDSNVKDASRSTKEFITAFLEDQDGNSKVSTGIRQFDDRTGGIGRGSVWVFGGLPGRGKSAILFQIAQNALWRGDNVLIFSLELMAEEVVGRILTAHGTADADTMQGKAALTKGDTIKIRADVESLKSKNFSVCDKGGLTIDEIDAYATRVHERQPLDLIVVDYIQLCEVAFSKGQSREQQVSQVSRRLKAIAKKFKCAVITASQLNDDGKMRESRAITQDADAVWAIKPNHKVSSDPDQFAPCFVIEKLRGSNPSPDFIKMELNGSKQRFEWR